MKDKEGQIKLNTNRPSPPKKPEEPVIRRIVNEKVINRDAALGRG